MADSVVEYNGQFDCTSTNYINLQNGYQIRCPTEVHTTDIKTDSTGKQYQTNLDVSCQIKAKPTPAPTPAPTQPPNNLIKIYLSPYFIGGIIFVVAISILLVFINKNRKTRNLK